MKIWLRISFVVLSCLLASCQQEESKTQPSPDPAEGTWVVYPPFAVIEASPKDYPAGNSVGNMKVDSLQAGQINALWQEALRRERSPSEAPKK